MLLVELTNGPLPVGGGNNVYKKRKNYLKLSRETHLINNQI